MTQIRKRFSTLFCLALLGIMCALAMPAFGAAGGGGGGSSPPVDPSGDDLFLITTAASPNVILMMDNSRSMNQIEWHPAFDPDASSYACEDFDNSRVYTLDEIKYQTEFDGINDYVEVPHAAGFITDNGTVSLWFNTSDPTQDGSFFSKDSSGFDTGGHLTIRLKTTGQVEVRFQSTTVSYYIVSPAAVTADEWHHVAFTFGSGGMELFVDGVSVGTNAYTGGTGTTSGGAGNFEPIAIGANAWGSGDLIVTPLQQFYQGFIDETAFFDSALTATEIADLYDAGVPNSSIDDYKLLSDAYCGNERTIWAPEAATLYDGRYLNWYFSDDADPFYSEIQTAMASIEGCTQSGGSSQFAEKYRRTRLEASKQVLLDLLCVAEPKNVRFALAFYRDTLDVADEDPNGGYVKIDLGRTNPNHASELESGIKLVKVNDDDVEATPLSETYFQAYTFWMSRDSSNIPLGADGITTFPAYHYDKSGDWNTNSNQWLEDGLEFECEKAFIVVVTDGLPTRDDFDIEITTNEATGFGDIVALVGDYHDELADGIADVEVPSVNPDEASFYLDDLAKFAQDNDFRPDLGGDQVVDTYTIGLATDDATNDYLQMTADVGNGLFFAVRDGDQLAAALIATLNDIIEKSASFTAAAVPSARTLDGGDFYQSFFLPSNSSAAWEGHLRAWKITALGEIFDKNGVCALDDPDTGECNSGPFLQSAEFYWDAHEQMPQPANRSLYTSKLFSGTPGRVPFHVRDTMDPSSAGIDAAELTIDTFTDDSVYPPDISPNDPLYQLFGSTAKTHEGLADEVIEFARGCFFGTGVTDTALVDSPSGCAARPARLGDIFHSNPIIVRRPASFFLSVLEGESYVNFKDPINGYGSRDRMIYAGTNAGFLEAFHAGDWQTGTSKYDEGTGIEEWGFMSWFARQNIKHLPIDAPTGRTHYMDGAAQVSDVWIYPSASATTKASNGSEWRTMLVTGTRRGGREYLALDITNPNGISGPGSLSLAYPGYEGVSGDAHGWEFPPEHDPDGWLPHMGFTWAQPIITRVRVTVNGGSDEVERWVAVVTAGYDENGDPNPDTVTGRIGTYDATAIEGRGLFLIDMKSGEVLARKLLDATALDAQDELLYSIPGTPAVFDLDNNGFADLIVVVDIGGHVYKWVLKDAGGDPINGSSAGDDIDQPNWPFVLLFQAPIEKGGPDDYYQNFFHPPAGALVDGVLWLAWGAGERKNLSYVGDSGFDENNRFYVLFDPDPYELSGLGTVTESDLIDATAYPGGITLTGERGFYIKAADGEKFVTNTVIFAGQVVTASFTPTPSLDPCAGRGLATAYVFDLYNGEGYFTDNNGDPDRTLDLGVGLPTDPRVSLGVGGGGGGGGGGGCDDNRVYIEKSGADLVSFGVPCIPGYGRLLYWRESE